MKNQLLQLAIHRRRKITWLLGLLATDAVLFGSTDARRVGALVLMVGFGLFIATVYWVIYGFLALLRLYGIAVRQKRRLAGSLAGLIACVVALQSVGELNFKDVLLLLPLVTVGYIYASYSLGEH